MMESTISRIASGGVLIVIVPTPLDEFGRNGGKPSEYRHENKPRGFRIVEKTPADEFCDHIEHSVSLSYLAPWRVVMP